MSKKRRAIAEINVVPYIDVMLVLLIIFMITAPIVQQGVKIELPKLSANSLPPEQQEPVILTVSKTGDYYLNIGDNLKKPVSDEIVTQRIILVLKQKPQTPILVRGDKDANYGAVTTAMVLLQTAGVEKVGLMTEQP
ncbi:Tol biopolymer transport system, TolR protein [hydrothermal vent metagenome]|uniref:Tol biopolymer transport system, TolR protein n=1 Tax=hydrothermal vent metagenome TaxID=652676 RepID=A0A3B0WPR6_9ZZZZ